MSQIKQHNVDMVVDGKRVGSATVTVDPDDFQSVTLTDLEPEWLREAIEEPAASIAGQTRLGS